MNIVYGNKVYYGWCQFGAGGYNKFRYNDGSYIGFVVNNSNTYHNDLKKCYWGLAEIRFPDYKLLKNFILQNYKGKIDFNHILYHELEEAEEIMDYYLIRLNNMKAFK